MNRSTQKISLMILMSLSAAVFGAGLSGTALITRTGLQLADMQTDAVTTITLTLVTPYNQDGNTHNACFSPDGKQIAFCHHYWGYAENPVVRHDFIAICGNDGSNIVVLCEVPKEPNTLTWTTTGYVYWTQGDSIIRRVDVNSKQMSTAGSFRYAYGITRGTASADGMKYASMTDEGGGGAWAVHLYDFGKSIGDPARDRMIGPAGCQGSVSPNGLYVTHNTFGDSGLSYHQMFLIQNWADGSTWRRIVAPGAVTGCSANCPRTVSHLFSRTADDFVVCKGEDGLDQILYVVNVTTRTYYRITGNPGGDVWDFWSGALPPPPAAAPVVKVNPASCTFTAQVGQNPANQTVAVTNAGVGTLAAVATAKNPAAAWLTITATGGGNTQTLTNAINTAGLARGSYTTTVTVSATGATSANYAVNLTVGSAVAAPTALRATQATPVKVALGWTDNANNEDGFVIWRANATGTFTRVGRTGANTASCADSNLTTGNTYRYLVAAYKGGDTSSFSDTATITLTQPLAYAVTSPAGGERWQVGSKQHIRWTISGALGDAVLFYSDDGGMSRKLITVNGKLTPDSTGWLDYVWTVPDDVSNQCAIIIENYAKTISASSPAFSIVAKVGVLPVDRQARRGTASAVWYGIDGRKIMQSAGSGNRAGAMIRVSDEREPNTARRMIVVR